MSRVKAVVRRHPVIVTGGVAVLLAAVLSAVAIWRSMGVAPVNVSLAIPTAPQLTPSGPNQTVYRLDATRSSVTYEVDEILAGSAHKATGTTRGIAGDVLIDNANPANSKIGDIVVNVEQLTSDQELRDNRIRHDFLESSTYPLATLRVRSISGMPAQIDNGKDYPLELQGDLEVKGTAKPVTLTATASRTAGDELKVRATTTVKLATWGIGPISLGPLVKTGDEATLTFDATAVNAAKGLPYDVLDASAGTTQPSPASGGPSFAKTVQPVLEKNCATCHNPGKAGSSVWTLDTAGDAAKAAKGLGLVTTSGYMPPWPASDAGVPLQHSRKMSAEEIKAIADWSAAGGPLDVDAGTKVTAVPDNLEANFAIRHDLELRPDQPYQGSTEKTNDYRCFILDPKFTEPTFITGFEYQPDQIAVNHHALLFKTSAAAVDKVRQLDDADPGTGWSCYAGMSGPGGSQSPDGTTRDSQLISGWVPGQRPNKLPDGSGVKMAAGDVLVLQVHYHFTHHAPPDRPTMVLQVSKDQNLDEVVTNTYLGPAEIPCGPNESGPLCDRDKMLDQLTKEYGPSAPVIANGLMALCNTKLDDIAVLRDGIASSSCDHRVINPGEILGVLGHEHQIGKTFRMTLNPGKPDEKVLLDIPAWDFNWQLVYQPVDKIMLKRGDTIRIECSWDRSLANQSEPHWVTWAEGTEDEMCYSTITVRKDKNDPGPPPDTGRRRRSG